MRVFLAGGTGVVGRRLIPQLIRRGHQVTATTTKQAKVAEVEALGADAVVVDGLDAEAVGQAVAAAEPEVIVHQMSGLTGQDPKHFDRSFAVTNRLRTEGTDHLLAAAQACGVRRFVAQSYTGWPNARSGSWIKTEDDPLDPDPPADQRQSLAAIRYLEERVTEAGGTVLRYGSFYGPGAFGEILPLVRRRRFPLIGGGDGMMSFVHLDDVASATVLAVEKDAPGIFNIVDDEPAPVAEWLPYLAESVGAKPPMRLPVWLARPIAGEVVVSMMTRTRGSSNARARRELGWEPHWPSWRQGFREALSASTGSAHDGTGSAHDGTGAG